MSFPQICWGKNKLGCQKGSSHPVEPLPNSYLAISTGMTSWRRWWLSPTHPRIHTGGRRRIPPPTPRRSHWQRQRRWQQRRRTRQSSNDAVCSKHEKRRRSAISWSIFKRFEPLSPWYSCKTVPLTQWFKPFENRLINSGVVPFFVFGINFYTIVRWPCAISTVVSLVPHSVLMLQERVILQQIQVEDARRHV